MEKVAREGVPLTRGGGSLVQERSVDMLAYWRWEQRKVIVGERLQP